MDHHHTIIGADHTGTRISISEDVRFFHTALFGSTGSGKSTLMEHMIAQDMARGDGVLVIDPHGPLAARALELVPPWRTNHVCVFDPSDTQHPVGWNPFHEPDHALHPRIADAFTLSMKAMWPDSWGPRLEDLMKASAATLLAMPDASPALMQRLLTDDAFRERAVSYVRNTTTLSFWNHEYASWTDQEKREARGPVMNKVRALLFFPEILHILGQRSSTLNVDTIMRERRIVIANLARGTTSESATFLIGSLLLDRFCAAGYGRAQHVAAASAIPHFHIYVDEARSFVAKVLRDLLRDMRKFKVSLSLASQGTTDLDPLLRSTVLDNAGTIVCFGLGPDDAEQLAPLMSPDQQEMRPARLTNLATGETYVKMRSPHGALVHHVHTTPPPAPSRHPAAIAEVIRHVEAVRKQSRRRYSRPADLVATYIRQVTSHTTLKSKRLKRTRPRLPSARDVADYVTQVNQFTADLQPAPRDPPPPRKPRRKQPPRDTIE
jgi:hypothetical protein